VESQQHTTQVMSTAVPIKVFCRVRATASSHGVPCIFTENSSSNQHTRTLIKHGEASQTTTTSSSTTISAKDAKTFFLDGFLNCGQDEIFEIIGKPTADHCLKGYNSTIMCYGQTGTGVCTYVNNWSVFV
jgi:hypothetical protein